MSILSDVNLNGGKITFNDLVNLSDTISLDKQVNELKEDLLQIEYPCDFLLDVGWYPSFEKDGNFRVTVVKDFNWDAPVYSAVVKTLPDLKLALSNAVKKIVGVSNNVS